MALLRIRTPGGKELAYRLPNAAIKIGRSPSSQIRLAGERVSRDHAQIEPGPDGFTITDLGSGNGTFVNGERIKSKLLAHGDEIAIAGIVLVFDRGEAARPEAAEAPEPAPAEAGLDEGAVARMKAASAAIRTEVAKIIVGQSEVLDQILAAMLARGHCLMVGVPGLAKTLMVRTIAQILDLDFKRVQFTPDLMPSDITGTDILEVDEASGQRSFRFIKGPIFTNILLADEINRTPPKTQAALLEAMQEYSVTASGYTYEIEPPFFVLATQNPLEQEGTYPLPEAQLDRFMFNILVDYPTETEEEAIVKRTTYRSMPTPRKILTAADILALQRTVWRVPVTDAVIRYATALVRASRPGPGALDFVSQRVQCGAGPRACQYLILGAKARAVLDGRLEATIDDVRACAIPVMRHRIFVNFNALSEGVSSTDIVRELVKAVPPPAERAPIVRVFQPTAPAIEKEMGVAADAPVEGKLDINSLRRMRVATARIRDEVQKVIIGQTEVLDQILMAMISRGHCLMVGVPGLAKTLTVRTIASVLDLDFKRVQFTPDLMPSDITGTDILEEDEQTGEKTFRFIRGPIFTNMLLADEINRTPPKTQAALLEAMQEYSVTASGKTYPLDLPFFVLATQNPLEQEGTYPLPEAQLDRFMFNIWVDYPAEPDENVIVKETTQLARLKPRKVIGKAEILALQDIVRRVPVSDHVVKYATRLVRATRPETEGAPKFIRDWIYCGAGPRACQYLILAAKARAVLEGRANVSCADVRYAALPVMRHRMFTNFNADSEGITTVEIIRRILDAVPEPGERDYVPLARGREAEPRKRPEAAMSFSPRGAEAQPPSAAPATPPPAPSEAPREARPRETELPTEAMAAAERPPERKIEAAPAAAAKLDKARPREAAPQPAAPPAEPKPAEPKLAEGAWVEEEPLPEGEAVDESDESGPKKPFRFRHHRRR